MYLPVEKSVVVGLCWEITGDCETGLSPDVHRGRVNVPWLDFAMPPDFRVLIRAAWTFAEPRVLFLVG